MKSIFAATLLAAFAAGAHAQASAPMPAPMTAPMPAASGPMKSMPADKSMHKKPMNGHTMKKEGGSMSKKSDKGAMPASAPM